MKINVSLASAIPLSPGDDNELYIFKPPVRRNGVPDTNGLGILPRQGHANDTIAYLRKLKITGYDWLPEHLSEVEIARRVMFFTTTHQYPDEVEARLIADGYKLKRIEFNATQWEALEAEERPASPHVDPTPRREDNPAVDNPYYSRSRFLWKKYQHKMSDWEKNFVKNIGDRLGKGMTVSPLQLTKLSQILTKYDVPLTATASRAYYGDDLSTLRSTVPNSAFPRFDASDTMHYAGGWHGNPESNTPRLKKTITAYRKLDKKRKARAEKKKQQEALDREKKRNENHQADAPTQAEDSLAADFGSVHGVGDHVIVKLQNVTLPAKVLAVSFMEGKVLYTVTVFTGFPEDMSMADKYGILNSVGWDEKGREYIRIPNLDSIYIESNPGL